jgi:hypothetical protein
VRGIDVKGEGGGCYARKHFIFMLVGTYQHPKNIRVEFDDKLTIKFKSGIEIDLDI